MNWRFFIDFCLKKLIFQCSYSLAKFWATCRYQEDFFIENQTYGQFLAYRSNRNFYYSWRLHVKHSFFANSPPDKWFTDFFHIFIQSTEIRFDVGTSIALNLTTLLRRLFEKELFSRGNSVASKFTLISVDKQNDRTEKLQICQNQTI